jgi:sulfoxide reductase catalytic subunit YedY
MNRRDMLRVMGFTSLGAAGVLAGCSPHEQTEQEIVQRLQALARLTVQHNTTFRLDRPLTEEKVAARYNNFYEFSSGKGNVWKLAQFTSEPWKIEVTGLVQKPQTFDLDDLRHRMPIEERHYRFRCVEAWAMDIPWIGFPMRALLNRVEPLAQARNVRLTTYDFREGKSSVFSNYPWPYNEGLTLAEAMNPLTLLAVGIYGHVLPKQHGAPVRLVVPWKYGFKSLKSIVRIELTAHQPATFWNTIAPREYDFRANVEPHVPHPRWSQAIERMIGTGERRLTLLYNGYEPYVAHLYKT